MQPSDIALITESYKMVKANQLIDQMLEEGMSEQEILNELDLKGMLKTGRDIIGKAAKEAGFTGPNIKKTLQKKATEFAKRKATQWGIEQPIAKKTISSKPKSIRPKAPSSSKSKSAAISIPSPILIPDEAQIKDRQGNIYQYSETDKQWMAPSKSGRSLNYIQNNDEEIQNAITAAWQRQQAAAKVKKVPQFD